MPFIPVANTAELVLRYIWDSQKVANVFHVEFSSAPTQAQLITLAEDAEAWWVANMKQIMPATLALVEVVARDLTTQNGIGVVEPVGVGVGTSTDASLPNHVTLAIKWNTGLSGRSYRGRTYHVGLMEGSVTNNTVIDAMKVIIAAKYLDFLAMINAGAGRTMVVVSKYSGVDQDGKPIPRAAGVTTPILSCTVDPTIDSQRRRLPGRGE